ncbi:MAG: T9SS type A sorting domain-containing protein [Agriterribacter sp.]
MKRIFTLISFLVFCYNSNAQVQGSSLVNIQGCGGATLIGGPVWGTGNTNPATLYYEKQVGTNWVLVTSQVWVSGGNYIIITPSDINTATLYRLRVRDEVSTQEFISAGVTVNPATWNTMPPFGSSVSASTSWGNACGSGDDYLYVYPGILPGGRPPYRIEYKKTIDADYTVATAEGLGAEINNILPNTNYMVRVTDFCGRVATSGGFRLRIEASPFVIEPTTCNNGLIRLYTSGSIETLGTPPFTYGIGKHTDTMTTIRPVIAFGNNATFSGLGPGDYDLQVKDACGILSDIVFVRLGGGLPRISVIYTNLAADSCSYTAVVTRFTGTYPLRYGILAPGQTQYSYQDDSVFNGLTTPGVYFFKIKDQCGDSSVPQAIPLSFAPPVITSVSVLAGTSSCNKNFIVNTGARLKPYQYGIRPKNTGSFVYQLSDTFRNIPQGLYDVQIIDRCGRVSNTFDLDITDPACIVRTIPGDFEVAGAQGCSNMTGNAWIDARDDNGNVVFSINPQGNNLQQVCWGVRITDGMGSSLRSAVINGSTVSFLDRNFYIEPNPAPTLAQPVLLRLYFTNTELSNMLWYLQNNGYPAASLSDLKILKKKGSAGSPVDLEVTNENITPTSQLTSIVPTIAPFGTNDWYMEFSISSFSELMTYMGNLSILPLRFISFTANNHGDAVALQWKTSNEINTKSFDVEWSKDAVTFIKIGSVASRNTPGEHSYSFEHRAPAGGNNYYRLKQFDADGKFVYSAVVKISIAGNNGIKVYPNPTGNDMQIVLKNSNEKIRQVQLTDATGKQLSVKQRQANHISLSLLPPGIYWLKIITDAGVYTLKISRL